MAASTTNTNRQLGATFGVANLGTLVNAHLTGDFTHRLKVPKIPGNLVSIIISAVETGTAPSDVKGGGSIENHVIQAAYGVFRSGLERSLEIAGGGMLIATAIAARTLSPRARIQRGSTLRTLTQEHWECWSAAMGEKASASTPPPNILRQGVRILHERPPIGCSL